MGEFFQFSGKGHESVIKWGDTESEREMARETFDRYRTRGFTMYRMDEDDRRGVRLDAFDPTAAGILAIPQMRGG